jgi:hypothetical protein
MSASKPAPRSRTIAGLELCNLFINVPALLGRARVSGLPVVTVARLCLNVKPLTATIHLRANGVVVEIVQPLLPRVRHAHLRRCARVLDLGWRSSYRLVGGALLQSTVHVITVEIDAQSALEPA